MFIVPVTSFFELYNSLGTDEVEVEVFISDTLIQSISASGHLHIQAFLLIESWIISNATFPYPTPSSIPILSNQSFLPSRSQSSPLRDTQTTIALHTATLPTRRRRRRLSFLHLRPTHLGSHSLSPRGDSRVLVP